jgi:hypothetical protein
VSTLVEGWRESVASELKTMGGIYGMNRARKRTIMKKGRWEV